MPAGIELTVASALVTDDGRGIARIDSKARKLLDVTSGDIIEIKGKRRSTAAMVWQAHTQDEGLDFIRIDGYIRQNIGVGIGDKVFVAQGGGQGRREGGTCAATEPAHADIAGLRGVREEQARGQADSEGRRGPDTDVRLQLQLHSCPVTPARHSKRHQEHGGRRQGGADIRVDGQDRRGALRGHRRPEERDTEDTRDGRAARYATRSCSSASA